MFDDNNSRPSSPSRGRDVEFDLGSPGFSRQATRRSLQRILLTLVIVGLVGGGFLAWGVVAFLNHYGLTDDPAPRQQPAPGQTI